MGLYRASQPTVVRLMPSRADGCGAAPVVGRDRNVATSVDGSDDVCWNLARSAGGVLGDRACARAARQPAELVPQVVRRWRMPQAEVDGLTINYDVQGEGEPLLLIPYLSADHACYAFQLPAYTEHFSCVAIDLPGSGESDKPTGPYSTDGYADQVATFLGAIGIERAHVAGAPPWASTSPPAIRTGCARCHCTAAGMPAIPI